MLHLLSFNYNGNGDFAQILQQLYVFMATESLSFPFNGNNYSFTLWECFVITIVFSVSVDVLVFGFHLMIRRL